MPQRDLNMPCIENSCFHGDSLGLHFTDLKVIAGGAHGCVFSAVDKTSTDSQNVALKRLSLKSRTHCRVALREIRVAKRLVHDNIVKVLKVTDKFGKEISSSNFHDREGLESLYLVQELMDSDLHNILEKSGRLPEEVSRIFLYQILRGLKYIHSSNVVHRDIKPGNLLVNLDDFTLKVGDFGLARVCDPRYDHFGHLTELVTTRYYRAPEVILEPGMYTSAVDMWSAGCVFAEMLTGDVLFCGDHDLQQADTILSAFGMKTAGKLNTMDGVFPSEKFPGVSPFALDLLEKLLCLDPEKRLSATEALAHPFFGELRDPTDEPVCARPFLVEHEVDDLSLKTLKRRIVSTCGNVTSKLRNYQDDVVFTDFDDVFVREEVGCRMDVVETVAGSTASTPTEHERSDSISSCSSLQVPSILSASSENNNCPSLSNVMNYDAMDEPCRDPGCFGLKDSFFEMDISDVNTEMSHCTSSYRRISPVMDLRTAVPSLRETKINESIEDTGMSEVKTNSNKNALNQYRTLCGRKNAAGSQNVFDRSREMNRLDSAGNDDIHTLNKKLVQQLGNTGIVSCRMAEIVASKHVTLDALGLSRLEPLRFWI